MGLQLELSTLNFLCIGITFATFSFSGNIPAGNGILNMIEESLVITSLSSLRILVGMLFSPTEFLILKFETILIISFSVPGGSKSES